MEILISSIEFLRMWIIFHHTLWPNCEGIVITRKDTFQKHIPSVYFNFKVLLETPFRKLVLHSYLLSEGNLQTSKSLFYRRPVWSKGIVPTLGDVILEFT